MIAEQRLDCSLIDEIKKLLEKKVAGLEIDIEPKSPVIIEFLKNRIDYYKHYLKTVKKETTSDYHLLNHLFRDTLKDVWN